MKLSILATLVAICALPVSALAGPIYNFTLNYQFSGTGFLLTDPITDLSISGSGVASGQFEYDPAGDFFLSTLDDGHELLIQFSDLMEAHLQLLITDVFASQGGAPPTFHDRRDIIAQADTFQSGTWVISGPPEAPTLIDFQVFAFAHSNTGVNYISWSGRFGGFATPAGVPEPSLVWLLTGGALGVSWVHLRRNPLTLPKMLRPYFLFHREAPGRTRAPELRNRP